MTRFTRPLLVASALALASTGALASETDRLLELLIQKQILTQQEADAIRSEAAAEKEAERVELVGSDFGYEPTAPLAVDEGAGTYVRRFGVETADGSERFRMRGRVQFDAAYADFGDDIPFVARQSHDFPDYGMILRRVRLGALGIMREKFEWQLEADFAENAVDLANVYMAYLMDHGGRLAVGHFKEPFGMEYATSSRYLTFLERSLPADAYKVDREPGIMYETIKPNWYAAAGFFGRGIDYNREVEEGYSYALRGSYAPYLQGKDFVHVGAGFNYRQNAVDKLQNLYLPVRMRAREGTRVIDARLIGRDDLEGVEDYSRWNLEFAAGMGSWWTQAEYYRVDLNIDTTQPGVSAGVSDELTLDGWYLYTGYFLTGESKPYRAFSGDWGQLRPNANFSPRNGTYGAFELALAYSKADSLEHTATNRGQKGERWTLGLNWYLTPEVLTRFNVIYLDHERAGVSDTGWVYATRFQYIF
jgi:phosphate-selective porin OprO and OprP